MSEKFKLGEILQDSITGFKGAAVARVIRITGCDRYGIQPHGLNRDGKTFGIEYFDENRLEKVKEEKPKKVKTRKSKGPGEDPVILNAMER